MLSFNYGVIVKKDQISMRLEVYYIDFRLYYE